MFSNGTIFHFLASTMKKENQNPKNVEVLKSLQLLVKLDVEREVEKEMVRKEKKEMDRGALRSEIN